VTNNVLITGAAGMVGSHLIDYLLIKEPKWQLNLFIRWQEDLKNLEHLFDEVEKNDRIKIWYGDLRDRGSIAEVFKSCDINYVFHLGAQSYPQTSFTNEIETYESNVIGTENLLKCVKEFAINAKVHNCSSSEVFGRVPAEKLPIDEECSFHPASPYAISKIGTDLIGRFYAEAYDMPIFTTRMFTHTGPRRGDVFAESTFAKQIALIEVGYQKPIIKVGNLDSQRTWADVRDAVKAYHMLVTSNSIENGAYFNIGGNTVKTIREMLDYLISLSDMKNQILIEEDPGRLRPIDADLQIPNTKKFVEATGWKPEYSFEDTMQDLLNYWRKAVSVRRYLSR
tara:strand:- start:6037 stop:7053 length:1017 start_codon:yes stop_codon:yes gene_type:complete